LAGSDFIITLEGDKLTNGIDYEVVECGAVSDTDIGFITFALKGVDNKDASRYELIGELEISRVEEPNYVTDVNGNKIAEFDTISVELIKDGDINWELIVNYQ